MRCFVSAAAAAILFLLGCALGAPDEEMVRTTYLNIWSDAGDLNSSARADLNFLHRYEYYLVDEYKITYQEELDGLYRQLWLREAVYQLRVAASVIKAVGPDGNLETVMAALDSAQTHDLTIGRIVAESGINAEKIVRDLRSQLWMYNPADRWRLEWYINIFEVLDDIQLRRKPLNGATVSSA